GGDVVHHHRHAVDVVEPVDAHLLQGPDAPPARGVAHVQVRVHVDDLPGDDAGRPGRTLDRLLRERLAGHRGPPAAKLAIKCGIRPPSAMISCSTFGYGLNGKVSPRVSTVPAS